MSEVGKGRWIGGKGRREEDRRREWTV